MCTDFQCPTGKMRFATASGAFKAINKPRGKNRPDRMPHRVYYCKTCQGYHMTAERQSGRRAKERITLDRDE